MRIQYLILPRSLFIVLEQNIVLDALKFRGLLLLNFFELFRAMHVALSTIEVGAFLRFSLNLIKSKLVLTRVTKQ